MRGQLKPLKCPQVALTLGESLPPGPCGELPFLLVLGETPSSEQPRVGQRVSLMPPLQGPGPKRPALAIREGWLCAEKMVGGGLVRWAGWLVCRHAHLCLPLGGSTRKLAGSILRADRFHKIQDSTRSWLLSRWIYFAALLSGDLFVNVKRNDTGTVTKLYKSTQWKSRKRCTEEMLRIIVWAPGSRKT